jgi:benzoyl-CoA reductase subunit B
METKERTVNRLETTGLVKALMARYYEDLRNARQDNVLLGWTTGPVPFELMRTMDVRFEHLESYGAYLAARRGQDKLKRLAEDDGYSVDVCSYARLTQGVAMLEDMGDTTSVSTELLVPKPDFMMGVNSCQIMGHIYDFHHRLFNVPGFMIDCVPTWHEGDFERNVAFTRHQMEQVITFLEELTGRKFDYDRLKEIMGRVKEAALLRVECMELSKSFPSPMSFFDHLISLGPMHVWRGTSESVEYFKKLKAELEERVANTVGTLSNERHRLYFDNLPIWFKLGAISEKLGSMGTTIVAGTYTHRQFYSYEPEKIDLNDPVDAIARELTYQTMIVANVPYRISQIGQIVKDYHLDGLLIHSARTCQIFDIGQPDIIDQMERKIGIPGVIIDGDPTDPAFYSDAQSETRLEAFIEGLDARMK